MKNLNNIPILKLLVICFTIASIIGSCKKDKKTTGVTEQEQLPAATQEGKNTFGCLINGEVFLPKNYSNQFFFSYKPLNAGVNSYGNIEITAHKINKDGSFSIIRLYSYGISQKGVYNLKLHLDVNQAPFFGTSYEYNPTPNNIGKYYYINDTINSTLEISKLDTIQKIMSGKFKFSFTLNNENIKVENGVFDLKLNN